VIVTEAVVGKIVKAVGLKGEVKLLPTPDFWFDVLGAGNFDLVSRDAVRRPVHIERYRTKGNAIIIKLSDIETVDDAETVIGCSLQVSLEDLDESLLPEKILPCQLLDLDVRLPDGSFLGKVVDILLGQEQDCFIVSDGDERFIVPNVPTVVRRIDLEGAVIEIDPPEGLLDLRW
jgi:16S rRNA processing protein RimM